MRGENLEHLALSKCCSVDHLEHLCLYWHLRASTDGNVSILCLNRAQSHISKSAPEIFLAKSVSSHSWINLPIWFWLVVWCINKIYCRCIFYLHNKFNPVSLTPSVRHPRPLCTSHLLAFFFTWADHTPWTFTHTHTLSILAAFPSTSSLPALYTSVRHSFLSHLAFPALSSRLLPLPPLPSFPRSLPILPLLSLLSSCLLPLLLPLLLSRFLFINLLGCYSPCLALLMKAGCRWGRRSSP